PRASLRSRARERTARSASTARAPKDIELLNDSVICSLAYDMCRRPPIAFGIAMVVRVMGELSRRSPISRVMRLTLYRSFSEQGRYKALDAHCVLSGSPSATHGLEGWCRPTVFFHHDAAYYPGRLVELQVVRVP